jgi:alginate O-acetyltransferase complex protein AlgI
MVYTVDIYEHLSCQLFVQTDIHILKEFDMLFSSTVFLLFFLPSLFLIYFLIPKKYIGAKNIVLLIFSLIFYAWGGVRYLLLLFLSIGINYIGGYLVSKYSAKTVRKTILILAVAVNLVILGIFKYAGFAASTIQSLGIPVNIPEIVLPVGISFFTFQGLSYVIDVYRNDAAVQKNPLNVALYISLFPQLVAGPIVRYTTIEKELSQRPQTLAFFSDGIVRFMLGFGKKMILANAMGEIADKVFALQTVELSAALAWVGAIAYTFQIYFDFSAYSDMAIGLGKMFGFTFLENFNYPYIAASITDFWRRWHISLSTWFRDYVYIPLGGNRCKRGRHVLNLMITWALTGLWHGANWTFIVWGIYFGILLILEKFVLHKVLVKTPSLIKHIYTLLLVIISWVLFRSDTIGDAISYIGVMFGIGGGASSDQAIFFLRQYYVEFILAVIAIFPIKGLLERFLEKYRENSGLFFVHTFLPKIFALAVFGLSYMKLVSGSFNPFIYFQF